MKKESIYCNFVKFISSCVLGACLLTPAIATANENFKLNSEQQNLQRKPINILGNWRISIIEIDGAFVRVPEQSEGANLQIGSNQITGVVGCNSFMSPYTASYNPQQIVIQDGASTKKMCMPEAMQFENAFLNIFIGNFMVENNFEGISLVRDNIKIYLVR